jgi:hypothetical protein
MTSLKQTLCALVLSLLVVLVGSTASATAAQACSGAYCVDQTIFSSGGELNSCSAGPTGYCSKQSAGELNVGEACSPGFCIQAGNNTERQPFLQFIVSNTTLNLGVLNTGSTASGTATFSVKTYLASGYVVINASPAPKNGGYTLHNLTSPTASSAGTEQFGINLVKNTGCTGLPATLGADLVQVPDSTFSFGTVASGYATPCQFKYNNGDTIAQSTKSSGETDYTISYIVNIGNVTPGGTYTMSHVLVATSTF